MSAAALPPPGPLAQAIVAETVRLVEANGPLDDSAALRQAFHEGGTRASQVARRAWLLGERLGLPAELSRWRQLAFWVVLGLAAIVAFGALGTARAVVGEDRSINAVAAFVTLLGVHLLMLAVWLLALLWPAALGSASLGRLALGVAARLPLDRGPHALTLLRATTALLQRQRLTPWLFGAISHTIWALAFVIMLGALAFAFAFHAYRLSWETTILSAGFFQRFVQITGALPALLGFPVPDAAAVQQVGNAGLRAWTDAASQREWAWWLMGCVLVYGLLPRALLALVSYARWRAGAARLGALDLADPDVRRIVTRLDALEPPQVVDAEQRSTTPHAAAPQAAPGTPGTWALLGFELPPESPWPPHDIAAAQAPLLDERIAGTTAERQQALTALATARPWRLLLVVHAASSPDRGTARFVREAARQVTRVGLAPVSMSGEPLPADDAGLRRWQAWLAAEQFPAVDWLPDAAAWPQWVASRDG